MKRIRFILLIAMLCMAIGMEAQDNSVDASNMPDPEVIKKEAQEDYERGNAYWKAKEVDKALIYYSKAADAGNPDAQYILGLLCNYWSVENMGYVSAKNDEQKTDATLKKIQALVEKL